MSLRVAPRAPIPEETVHAREGTGYDQRAFRMDWAAHTATCPHGQQRRKWHPGRDGTGQEVIQSRFAAQDCRACPVRTACTRARIEPRTLTVRTQVSHEALHAARQLQTTAAFKEKDATRAGIESTLSQGVRAFGLRRARYVGLAKTPLQHVFIAVAMNVRRVRAWCSNPHPAKPRVSPFAALASPG